MSDSFRSSLLPILPAIVRHFGSPGHIYYGPGIRETGKQIIRAFGHAPGGYRQFFAVKACPNPQVLRIMLELGFGFDCSSIAELRLVRSIGAKPIDIMFTANNTGPLEYAEALAYGGCILNLDDISFIPDVPEMPELICFRWNQGPERLGNSIIGNPVDQKYGVPTQHIIETYRQAIHRGAKRFGLHVMACSNCLEDNYFVETVRGLLAIAKRLKQELGIELEFINMGGGVGIPYRPEDKPVDLNWVGNQISDVFREFHQAQGYAPKLLTEFGRLFAPNGVLLLTVINIMQKYKKFVGVDAACTATMMRPAVYYPNGGYHDIVVYNADGRPQELVNVVGPVCENCDQFARDRLLPQLYRGDRLLVQDTLAHCNAMASNYNGHLKPQELMLDNDSVRRIREAQTYDDYISGLDCDPCLLETV